MQQRLSELSPIVAYDGNFTFNGSAISSIVDVGGFTLHGIQVPDNFTGTTITLQRSIDNNPSNLKDIYDVNGNVVTINVVAGRYRKLDIANTWGERFIALKASASQAAGVSINAACAGY